MSATPYMQFYVGDYIKKTLHLTTEQHGAYLLLLFALWNGDATLPNDPAKLARITRVSPKRWPGVWSEIAGFFTVDGDKITQDRLTEDRQKVLRLSQERKNFGSLGGKAKALKSKDADVAKATILPEQNPSISEPEPYQDKERREAKASPRKRTRLPENWVPSDRNISDAIDRNFSPQEIDHEATAFRDYHLSKGTTFADWDAGWRTWLSNARKFAGSRVAGPAFPGRGGQGSSLASIAARRQALGIV